MNGNVSLTTVMAIYNADRYLKDAIKSILSQTFADFELLLINDASPDHSLEICNEFAQKDPRIRVIDLKENVGASGVRNIGISEAKGSYIHFMDSDDLLDDYAYQMAMDSLKVNPAKVVMFGLVEDYYDKDGKITYKKEVVSPAAAFKTAGELREHIIEYENNYLYGYAWNKIYQTEYIRKIGAEFQPVYLNEDILFNIDYFMDIDSLNVLEITPYHYAKRGIDSVTSQYSAGYFEWHRARVERLCQQFKYWDMFGGEVKCGLAVKYVRFIMSALERNLDKRSGMDSSARKKWLTDLYGDKLFLELIDSAKSDSRIAGIFCRTLQGRKTGRALFLAWAVHFVKTRFPMIFAKIK